MHSDAAVRIESGTWPLVGRHDHLAALERAFADTTIAAASVGGPAGVGKSRLVQELAARLARRRATVVRVVATAGTEAVPLLPVASLLPAGDWSADRPDDVADRVVESLAGLGDRRSLVITIDDAPLLDTASARVVRAIAERGAAFVVGTIRTGEAGHDADTDAPWHALPTATVEVPPLTEHEIGSLLEAVLGGPVAGDTVRRFTAATGGLPLPLRELVTSARERGDLAADGGVWRLAGDLVPTERLRDLVAGRIARMAAPQRSALHALAFSGPLPRSVAERIAEPEILDDLLDQGLLVTDDGALRLSHPLQAEVLRTGLGVLARRSLAGRLAAAAEAEADDAKAHGRPTPVDVVRLVSWRLEAGDTVPPRLLLAAARLARRMSELDLAERLLHLALGQDASMGPVDPAALATGTDAAVLLGEVLFTAGRFDEADAAYGGAATHLTARLAAASARDERLGLLPDLAVAAISRGFAAAWGRGRMHEARSATAEVVDLLDRLPEAREPDVAAFRAELAIERASYLAFAGEPHAALAEAGDALASLDGIALTDTQRARVQVRASHAMGAARLHVGPLSEAIAVCERGLAAARLMPEGFGRSSYLIITMVTGSIARSMAGDLDAATDEAARAYGLAVGANHRSGQALAAWARGRVALNRFNPRTAKRWCAECWMLERDLRTRGRRRWALVGLAAASTMLNELAEADGYLAELAALDAAEPVDERFLWIELDRARAWQQARNGELSAATGTLQEAAARAASTGEAVLEAFARYDLLLLGDDRANASRLLELTDDGPVDGPLGETAALQARGVLRGDPAAQLAAARRYVQLGARLQASQAASAAWRSFTESGRRGSAAEAERLMRDTTDEHDDAATMVLWSPRLARLTARQREIVALAAMGLSNGDIADRLDRSSRTVENQLHRAYQELGVSSRDELSALLAG
ncbi:MAG: sigma factor-like helix-turn-helix DNA-binding protein [Acidimicrobiales bacterium]